MEALSGEETRRAAQLALAEDVGSGDITTLATIPATATAKAVMLAREPLVVAGLPLGEAVFRELSSDIRITRAA
ncbi:MAG: nicotinate-nucleotide diphosphorylase (carboxylating), partial [Verrucomicrobia bacterium]